MILQSLVDYYDRRTADPNSGIAPYGWERKALPFIIEIDTEGRLVQIADTREADGKRLIAQRFLVPQAAKRSVGVVANLLWDNVEYALGVPIRGDPDRVARLHRAFREAITDRFGDDPDDPGLRAVLRLLGTLTSEDLERQSAWAELAASNPFLSFRMAGDTELVCNRPAVATIIDAGPSEPDGLCLVTGKRAQVARLHPSIQGVRGTNTTGGSLVSFNEDAFKSYGQQQGAIAPVGKPAAFAYTTALNDLLRLRRRTLAGSTIVYWTERPDGTAVENAFAQIIAEAAVDDPLAGTRAVESPRSRVMTTAVSTSWRSRRTRHESPSDQRK
jgi:CRISPR-associated protein Csd1